jgi:hypothetical protein
MDSINSKRTNKQISLEHLIVFSTIKTIKAMLQYRKKKKKKKEDRNFAIQMKCLHI